MPELGPDFVAHIAHLIARQRPDLGEINQVTLAEAFALLASARNFFMEALGQVLSPLATHTGRFEDAMLAKAAEQQRSDEAQMESDYTALRPLEQAVLWRMLELGTRFRPYDADALQFYAAKRATKSPWPRHKSLGGPARPPAQPGLEIRPQ
jgi:hypothetical protein